MPPHPRRGETTIGPQDRVWNDGLADKEDGPGTIAKQRFKTHIHASAGDLEKLLTRLVQAAPDRVWLGAVQPLMGDDARRLRLLNEVARRTQVPLLATNDVLYHAPRAPRVAGRRHLHPRARHASNKAGQAARSQCRASSEIAAGDGAPVPRTRRRPSPRPCASRAASPSRSTSSNTIIPTSRCRRARRRSSIWRI